MGGTVSKVVETEGGLLRGVGETVGADAAQHIVADKAAEASIRLVAGG